MLCVRFFVCLASTALSPTSIVTRAARRGLDRLEYSVHSLMSALNTADLWIGGLQLATDGPDVFHAVTQAIDAAQKRVDFVATRVVRRLFQL